MVFVAFMQEKQPLTSGIICTDQARHHCFILSFRIILIYLKNFVGLSEEYS